MANGTDRGPIDFSTELQIEGARTAERGFARMWSAGASEAVKAAYMQSADKRGAEAAENIRRRYYKKEFEQILNARVKPLQERLQAAKEVRDKTMSTTVMPVTHVLSPAERQQRANMLRQDAVLTSQLTAGTVAKKGEEAGVVQTTPEQSIAANAAIDQQVGETESEEVLALIDPVTAVPVPLNSGRGINIWRKAELDFWGEYTKVNQELMNIMSEYQGNPYADKYSENLINMNIKQANIATTGKTDPLEAQKYMEDRQRFEAEQQTREQEVGTGQFKVETREAALNVAVRRAGNLMKTDPLVRDMLGKTIVSKLERGQELTRPEKFEAANTLRTYDELQEKEIARREKDNVFRIPAVKVPSPELWQGEMRVRDPIFKQYYGEEFANIVNNLQTDLAKMPQEEQRSILTEYGALPQDIEMFVEGGRPSPTLQATLERMANTKENNMRANDIAELRRLPQLENTAVQPELKQIIDQTIENIILELKAEGVTPNEQLIRADRYRAFFEAVHGRPAPMTHDPRTLENVYSVLTSQKEREEARRRSLLPETAEVAPQVPEIQQEDLELLASPKAKFNEALLEFNLQQHERAQLMAEEERKRQIQEERAKRRKQRRVRRTRKALANKAWSREKVFETSQAPR